jgi:hypothetical protein
MSSRIILICLLACGIGLSTLIAGERIERTLADIDRHCRKMLDVQLEVHKETKRLHKVIEGHTDNTPRPEDRRAALKLSADMKAIVGEATKAMDALEADGSAVAFTDVFRELREDLNRVADRLELADVGKETQATQEDVIETLREMIEALTKG